MAEEEKKKDVRKRDFSLVSYLSEKEILSVFKDKERNIVNFWFILHDKDVDENGELKLKHFHIVLQLNYATTFSAVRKWFKVSDQNTLAEPVKNMSAALRYLIHLDNPDKTLYSTDDVFSSSAFARNKFLSACAQKDGKYNPNYIALKGLLDGTLSLRDLAETNPDVIINHFCNLDKFLTRIKEIERK